MENNSQTIFTKHELYLTHMSLASFVWDKGNVNSPRWDDAKHGVLSGAIPFAYSNFIEK